MGERTNLGRGVAAAHSLGCLIILDVEVSEFILVLSSSDHAQVLLEILLLEVLLGQVLEVPLAEGNAGLNDDALGVLGDSDS